MRVTLFAAALLAWTASLVCSEEIIISWGYDTSEGTQTVSVGDTVTWVLDQEPFVHTVTSQTSGDEAFNSGFKNYGEKFSHTFNVPGVYDYYCIPHPFMTGTITVEGVDTEHACCLTDGTCTMVVSRGQCDASGGVFRDSTTCGPSTCAVSLEPFVDPLPIPSVAIPDKGRAGSKAHYVIRMQEFKQKLHRDLPSTTVWGYEGTFPGPTIEAWSGEPIKVTWINELTDHKTGLLRKTHYLPVDECIMGPMDFGPVPLTMPHVHGGEIPFRYDGHPDFQFPPGSNDTFYYPNDQEAAMLWYHDHGLGITRLNVYMGMAGAYIIRDAAETEMMLPSGKYEIPLVITDRDFTVDGQLRYPEQWQGMYTAPFMLVNGKVWPYLEVERRAYRFRILNACNSRLLKLKMTKRKAKFWVIGSDLGLLPKRAKRREIQLAPAERLDVVVDFSRFKKGKQFRMINTMPATEDEGNIDVMRFMIMDTKRKPKYKPPGKPRGIWELRDKNPDRVRTFVMGQAADECTGTKWVINGRGWEDLDEVIERGSIEVWEFVNPEANHFHPMHLHLVGFQVLDRQDISVSYDGSWQRIGKLQSYDRLEGGWKDTVYVGPRSVVRVITKFGNTVGRFPYHCHVLEHEDHDMMRQFWVHHKPQHCNNNGVCEDREDCASCPKDCQVSHGAVCGNGLCEAGDGENCGSCPQDCAGQIDGVCCGFGDVNNGNGQYLGTSTGCSDPICTATGYHCRVKPQIRACCGDSVCWGGETEDSCPIDCPQRPGVDFDL